MQHKDFKYKGHRNSYTELNEVYFWTITINQWHHLLRSEDNKMIVVNSLLWLVNNELVKIYGYVIMPNHIHLIWETLKMSGKEFPKNSFKKFTAKTFVKRMQDQNDAELINYAVKAEDRKYNIWQRDPLAIKIFNREIAIQKLNYMHLNPLQPHWTICEKPEDYRFSLAVFYNSGVDEFNLITHFREVF